MGGQVTKGKQSIQKIISNPINQQSSSRKMNLVGIKQSSSRKIVQVNNSGSNYSSPRGQESDKIKINSSVTTLSSFNQTRYAKKKQKIIISARPQSNLNKETSEISILQVVKKNNYNFEDQNLINNCLEGHFFMRILEATARKEIIKEMTLCSVEKGETLFKQGSIGNYFYIVKEGELELQINNTLAKTFTAGESFGELALLHGAPRSGTVVAIVNSYLYCLERRNFRKIVDHVNSMNYEENRKFINNTGILCNIEDDLKSILANKLLKEYYEPEKFVVKEGEQASCLFIIKEGEVECSTKGKIIRTLKKGDHFGEKSILLESTRTMDVITTTSCVIYSISVETLHNMVGDRYKDILYLSFIKMSFQQSKVFSKINMKLLEHAYECFQIKDFSESDVVVDSGHVYSSKIMIIIEGSVVNKKINQVIGRRGDILFEDHISTLSKNKTYVDLTAEPDCLIAEANTADFIKFMGGTNSFKELLKKSNCLTSLCKIPLFKNFTQKKMESLMNMVKIENFENGKKIIIQGETDDKFYIVKSGKVDIFVNSNYIRTLNDYESFGERALFFKEPRTATAQANGFVELYVIKSIDFKLMLEDNLADYLKNRLYLQDSNVELKDLDFVKELGNGNFGSVSLVRHRKNRYDYAIKSMSKKQIDYEQLHPNIELERNILLRIDHPFIVKLVKTLKTEKHILFLMEYIKGKELFDVIRDIGLLNKVQTQFYGCSLMLAIEYLHERKCIYRDIKPENSMIAENGFLKLIDFGTVKEILDRTTTIIGTPHYMSPEVILGDGYSFPVDYWSIAICMYEFICGGVPFGESAEEPMDVYLSIINSDLKFPSFVKDKEFISLIKKMLTKSPLNRLCKFSQIKNDVWFKEFSWENLISLNLTPPYIPKTSTVESKSTTIAYINYLKTSKEFQPTKSVQIDKNIQLEYDAWFKNF